MLTGEDVLEIRVLHRQGRSIRAIARDLKVSQEMVRKYLRAPDREPGYGPRAPRPSKLDPFKDYIRQMWSISRGFGGPAVQRTETQIAIYGQQSSISLQLKWWVMRGSNSRHLRCKRSALPTELITRCARFSQETRVAQEGCFPRMTAGQALALATARIRSIIERNPFERCADR